MNERLTYEQIIAAKLEQLAPMPALADSIWSRISADLDREMPPDDAGGSPGGGASLPGSGTMLWPGFGVLLMAVAGLLYWYSQRISQPAPAMVPPGNPANTRPASAAPANTGPPATGKEMTWPDARNTGAAPAAPDTARTADDLVPALPAVQQADSSPLRAEPPREEPAATPLPATAEKPPAATIDTPLKKKPRGVTGISNNDYRIVPDKKDTARKKN